jgi:hypothetical protein
VLLPVWWTLWLISVFVSGVASHALDQAEEAPQLANAFVLASHVAQIPLDVVFILIIRQIYRMQMEQSTLGASPDIRGAATASA